MKNSESYERSQKVNGFWRRRLIGKIPLLCLQTKESRLTLYLEINTGVIFVRN